MYLRYDQYTLNQGLQKIKTRTAVAISAIALVLASGVGLALVNLGVTEAAAGTAVYDATPATLPPNVASLGYEATSTSEFGDYVHLGGTSRTLNTVTVTMSDWALHADYPSLPAEGWTHPITINVYSNNLGSNGAPDTLLATKKQTVNIPWRPAADPTCAGGTAWRATDGNCYNGEAFNATFDMSSLNVTLPTDVIVSVAYNTANYGTAPLGQPGPYNSLNVGIPTGQVPTVGADDSADKVFWNTSHAPFYTDGGTAGVGILRQDTSWAPTGTVALQVTTVAPATAVPTGLTWTNPNVVCGGETTSTTITADWNDSSNAASYEYTVTTPGTHNASNPYTTTVTPSQYSGVFNEGYGVYTYSVKAVNATGQMSASSQTCSVNFKAPQPVSATDKEQCKNDGWKLFAANYKNQGQCVASVVSSPNSKINR